MIIIIITVICIECVDMFHIAMYVHNYMFVCNIVHVY